MHFSHFHLQLRADAKFNLIVTRILGQYITFRAKKTAANRSLGNEQVMEICAEIWNQIDRFVGPNYAQIIMILLLTTPQDYALDVVLYPLFNKTHELILRQQRQTLPEIIVIILAVLFYRHWIKMCTTKEDTNRHNKKAMTSLQKNFDSDPMFPWFKKEVLPEYMVFVRSVDDRIYHSYSYKETIW